jgi:hypothetical protein
MIIGRNDRYSFAMPSWEGGTLVIERSAKPVPLLAQERAEWDALAKEFVRVTTLKSNTKPSRNNRIFEAQPSPKMKPPFADLMADDDGRVWVTVPTTATKRDIPPPQNRGPQFLNAQITWREANVYDVFESDGRFAGRVALKERERLLGARGNRIWVRQKGENDEDIIGLYRLVRQ